MRTATTCSRSGSGGPLATWTVVVLGTALLLGGCARTRIAGRVLDEDQQPVRQVAVETDPATDFIATSYDGSFAIERVLAQTGEVRGLTAGKYSLKLKKVGYVEQTVRVEVDGPGTTQLGAIVLRHKKIDPLTVEEVTPVGQPGPGAAHELGRPIGGI